ncbi:MAG: ferrous iron transport protein B, partial [bacterium]|nr:ferrous iron transport protein B [bacterium]
MHNMNHTHKTDKNAPQRVVIVGNPNAGKSAIFNAITGMYVDVSNFPGTTVEIAQARIGDRLYIDTPGVYGISSLNDEERVTREVVLTASVILNVVNAAHLERDLFLTQQCIDLGLPMVVAVNMVDDAKSLGIAIDLELLEHLLGVPVIPTIAVKNWGIDEVIAALNKPKVGIAQEYVKPKQNEILNRIGNSAEALLFLEDDEDVARAHGLQILGTREEIYLARRTRVNDLVAHVVKEINEGVKMSTLLSRLMINPVTGIPMLMAVLYAMYYIIGVFIAQTVVGVTEEALMQGIYEPAVRTFVERYMVLESVLGQILVGEFGLLTMTLTYVFGLLLPLVIGFYLTLSILEDSGYLPRIAALVDRAMTSIGLNGRAVIPMILGFGCVTMATITTRLLGTSREKLIAIVLLAVTIPCSAQLGVIVGLLGPLGWQYMLIYVGTVFSVFVAIGVILNKVLPGKSSDLLIDLPPLRLPRLDNVFKKTFNKSYMFLSEATPLFALGALIITILNLSGLLLSMQDALSPLTVGWLRLPKEAANAFIMGIVRRDFGAAGL